MNDEFANRQAMHQTVLDFLDQPASKAIWAGKPPVRFTAKVAELRQKVAALTTLIAEQQTRLTGLAADKDREEEELEDLAFEIGQTLAAYFEDNGRDADAEKIGDSRSGWRRLRDTALLAKAELLQTILDAALADDTPGLAEFGITPADSTALAKEREDYAQLIAAPASGIAGRAARTRALRPSFREASEILASLDRLVVRFQRQPGGPAFVANWRTARIVRDLGAGPGEEQAPPPAPEA